MAGYEPAPAPEATAVVTPMTLDQPLRAIAILCLGIALFSTQDVAIKWLSGGYPVHQIVFVRSIVGLLPILLIAHFDGGWASLWPRRPWLHLFRALLAFASYTTYYLALAALELADAVALFFSTPLFVTVLSVFLLKEEVGLRRWVAVLVGFLGVLVMMRPGSAVFEPAAFLAVAAALAYALSIPITRKLGASSTAASMALSMSLAYLAASVLIGLLWGDGSLAGSGHPSMDFLLRAWRMPAGQDLAIMVYCGLIAGCGFYCLSQAYRLGPASVVTPFEYSALPWAVVWGFLIWGDLPDGLGIAGILLVVGSGLYVLHREAVLGRKTVTGRPMRPRL